jgi:hypothetical protein
MTGNLLALAAVAALIAGCGSSSEPAPSGIDEPFRVRFTPPRTSSAVPGQFFRGPLPTGTDGPLIAAVDNRQSSVFGGEQGKRLAGNASGGSTGVGFQFAGLGTGFWVAPVLIPDNEVPGTLSFQVQLDFSRDIPDGKQTMLMAAVDVDGHWGPSSSTPFYFQATQPSGAAVASLVWDNNADLDLQIITPSGKQVDAKHVSTDGFVDGGFPPGSGVLDRDSNASCVPDGHRQEDLIWTDAPTPGLYLAKVDMFSACGEPAANFVFRLYWQNQLIASVPGKLLSIDADNGMGPGLALTNFQFQ